MANKYNNKVTVVDGISFDSKKEAFHYVRLRGKEQRGEISDLRLQVQYELLPALWDESTGPRGGIKRKCLQQAVHYVADFVYEVDGEEVVVDVKSAITRKNPVYILKKKMMRALLGIEIKEL